MPYFTRSKAATGHKAAGVLPFSLHEGAVLVLLGAEPCKTGPGGKVWRTMWRDFGGGREAGDADSAATAAREFAEETLGLFGGCAVDAAGVAAAAAAMEPQLRDERRAVKVVHSLRRGAYHFYCTQTPWLPPLFFRLASQQNYATRAVAGAEKSAFAWVPMQALLECVAAAAPRYFLEARAHVCGGPDTPPAAHCGRRQFQASGRAAGRERSAVRRLGQGHGTAQQLGLRSRRARVPRRAPHAVTPPYPAVTHPPSVQLHPCFANSLRMAQKHGLHELVAACRELPLPPPPPLPRLAPPPAPPAGEGAAGGAGSQGDSVGYWLAQEEIGAALRGATPAGGDADLPSGIWLPPQQPQQLQQRRGRGQQRGRATAAAGPQPASPLPVALPAASGSSTARASSVDTASSLRQHREAVAAAAVEQVVLQIEQNGRVRARPSRKQRQKLRRQRQRAAEAAAVAAAAEAAAQAAAQQQQQQQQQQQHSAALSASAAAAAVPHQWAAAARELGAAFAFEPRLRLCKRLRVEVGD